MNQVGFLRSMLAFDPWDRLLNRTVWANLTTKSRAAPFRRLGVHFRVAASGGLSACAIRTCYASFSWPFSIVSYEEICDPLPNDSAATRDLALTACRERQALLHLDDWLPDERSRQLEDRGHASGS